MFPLLCPSISKMSNRRSCTALASLLFAFIVLIAPVLADANADQARFDVFQNGEVLYVECRNSTGGWGKGPVCKESGKEMSFIYGQDSFVSCGWYIDDQSEFDRIARIIEQKDVWMCRVPMTRDRKFFIPFTIPIWGIVEGDHLHMDNHMNVVFHADLGHILGVAFYPVRDRFQFAKPGSLVTIHGPVRWFRKQGFEPFTKSGFAEATSFVVSHGILIGWSLVSSLFTLVFGILVFRFYYRPRLLKRYKKDD